MRFYRCSNSDTYLVQVDDKLLGTIYCSEDEAFTEEELQSDKRVRLRQLIPIDISELPGTLRKKLTAVFNQQNEED